MLLWSDNRNKAINVHKGSGCMCSDISIAGEFWWAQGCPVYVDTCAFPFAQQLRCVTIEMSRVVCASTCTTRIQSMLFPVHSLKSFSSCSVQNCHVLHLDCQPSTACHSLLSLPIASCWCSTVSFESGNDAVSHRCHFVKARDVAHCVLRSVTRWLPRLVGGLVCCSL